MEKFEAKPKNILKTITLSPKVVAEKSILLTEMCGEGKSTLRDDIEMRDWYESLKK